MLAIEGLLRGLWVGLLAAVAWAVISRLTGWSWMQPLNMWVFAVVMLVAGLVKIVNERSKSQMEPTSGRGTLPAGRM